MKVITPDLKLTADEVRLVMLHRASTDSAQDIQLQMAKKYAEIFPRHVTPRLRLIAGGAA